MAVVLQDLSSLHQYKLVFVNAVVIPASGTPCRPGHHSDGLHGHPCITSHEYSPTRKEISRLRRDCEICSLQQDQFSGEFSLFLLHLRKKTDRDLRGAHSTPRALLQESGGTQH